MQLKLLYTFEIMSLLDFVLFLFFFKGERVCGVRGSIVILFTKYTVRMVIDIN